MTEKINHTDIKKVHKDVGRIIELIEKDNELSKLKPAELLEILSTASAMYREIVSVRSVLLAVQKSLYPIK